MDAAVTTRFYAGLGHRVNADELAVVRAMLGRLTEETNP